MCYLIREIIFSIVKFVKTFTAPFTKKIERFYNRMK